MPTVSNVNYPLLFLSSIHKRRYRKSHTMQFPKIPGDVLCVVTQGKGMMRIQNGIIPIGPNQILFLQPSMALEVMLESDYADYYLLTLRQVAAARSKGKWTVAPRVSTGALFPAGKLSLQPVKPWIESVEALYASSRTASRPAYEVQLQFQSLIGALLREVPRHGEVEESSHGIDQSIGYMFKHYNGKIKLGALADIAGLTETSYSRSFKRTKGVTPVQYLNQIRIDSSKEMLQQDCSIQEVAESVGIGNELYFSRMFKRAVGVSPTIYIKRKQLRVGVASCYRYQENLRTLGTEATYEMNGYTIEEQSAAENRKFVQDQLDALRDTRPDLILSDYRHRPFYERLKDIAPTLCLDFTMDWRRNHWRIAELVGREKEAQHNFDQMDRKIAYAREVLEQLIGNETFSVLRFYYGKIRVYGMVDHPMNRLLFKELGLKPGSIVPQHERSKEYALEMLPPFETDHLLLYKHHVHADEDARFSALMGSETWSAMQAVRRNRIRNTPNWIGMSWAPSGLHQIIDYLVAAYSSERPIL